MPASAKKTKQLQTGSVEQDSLQLDVLVTGEVKQLVVK